MRNNAINKAEVSFRIAIIMYKWAFNLRLNNIYFCWTLQFSKYAFNRCVNALRLIFISKMNWWCLFLDRNTILKSFLSYLFRFSFNNESFLISLKLMIKLISIWHLWNVENFYIFFFFTMLLKTVVRYWLVHSLKNLAIIIIVKWIV